MIEDGYEFSKELYELSQEYLKQRTEATENELSFTFVLTARLDQIKAKLRANAGIEMCQMTLLAGCEPEVSGYYRKWKTAKAQYQGLEKVIDAVREKIQFKKAILKADH